MPMQAQTARAEVFLGGVGQGPGASGPYSLDGFTAAGSPGSWAGRIERTDFSGEGFGERLRSDQKLSDNCCCSRHPPLPPESSSTSAAPRSSRRACELHSVRPPSPVVARLWAASIVGAARAAAAARFARGRAGTNGGTGGGIGGRILRGRAHRWPSRWSSRSKTMRSWWRRHPRRRHRRSAGAPPRAAREAIA